MMRVNKGFGVAAAGAMIFGFALAVQAQDASDALRRTGTAPVELAQGYGVPPGDIGDSDGPRGRGGDETPLLLRLERLEGQVRTLNGQVEQMQFENHRLEEQLRKFQQDVDFRLQESGGGRPAKPQKRGDLQDSAAPSQAAGLDDGGPGSPATPATVPQRSRRGDAYDPAAEPDAPGAPLPLGSSASASTPNAPAARGAPLPSGPVATEESDPGAPLELSSSAPRTPRSTSNWPDAPNGPPGSASATPRTTAGGAVVANAQPNSPAVNPLREELDVALGFMKQKEYENAERGFSAFLQKNPKSRYSAEAIYYLGESFYQRGRQREAAEQYLKISTDYATSPRAPEALLRLGQSLHALGAKEQACASFTEIGHKYPNASAGIKAAAEREAKRVQC